MVFPNNFNYEKALLDKGIRLVAGVDEVGRGPLAGPFVAAAVILDLERLINLQNMFDAALLSSLKKLGNNDVLDPKFENYKHIDDSKKISEKKREKLAEFIKENAVSYSIIEIESTQLDKWGMSKTTQEAFYQAVTNLHIKPEHVLIDGFEMKKLTRESQTFIAQGDTKSISVGAASIIAKVYRDHKMCEFHEKFPIYGFNMHKGYGTKLHLAAIREHGVCEIHRRCFEPVKSVLACY